ncbi:HNH endonuclease family protein [Actinomadura fulvescens]|uniref:HNH endonuclease family protein n=1 Tax=Actinomadura fulvescens TaxID=46160 RepID=A0ABP6CR32_9ACTN
MRLRTPSTLLPTALAAAMALFALVPSAPAAASAPAGAAAIAAAAPPPLLVEAITQLPVSQENRAGYKRTSFRHWIDADRDGCHTRHEVLLAEAIQAPDQGARCALSGAVWWSYYDDITITEPAQLDVDHLVPLAEAWDSGASAWDAARRQAYANDLDDARHLVAVTARSNRQKADQDPATWLPPHPAARCRYAIEWVSVKRRWQLAVDNAEKTALHTLAGGCPGAHLTTDPAAARNR